MVSNLASVDQTLEVDREHEQPRDSRGTCPGSPSADAGERTERLRGVLEPGVRDSDGYLPTSVRAHEDGPGHRKPAMTGPPGRRH